MLDIPAVRSLIRLALEEDLPQGDVTTAACIEGSLRGNGTFVAKEPLVICGLPLLEIIVREAEADLSLGSALEEGTTVEKGAALAVMSGKLTDLLRLERTFLNFLQRLCGVATFTRSYVAQAGRMTVLDTRKTIPGWRVLDKYATRIGGARNHRYSLSDMILVKNNHVDAQAGATAADRMTAALESIYRTKSPLMNVEVEVRSMEELEAALRFAPYAIMLDNMDDEQIQRAAAVAAERAPNTLIEVSGGIRAGRLPALDRLGAGFASVGALTTHAPNVDISFRISKTA